MKPIVPDFGIKFPDDPFTHVIPVNKIRELSIDAKYPFLDKSFRFTFMRNLMHLGIFVLVFPLSIFRFGLKIRGRKNLRKYRNVLKNGVMTVSNHIHRWDFLFILQALRYRKMFFPAWKENLLGPDLNFIRYAGGIPVPEDIHTIRYFNQAFDEICAKKIWIHVYPESALWYYYRPIRPFKKGVFSMAYRYNLPVLPIGFYYEKTGISLAISNLFRKKKLPSVIVHIGEPLFPDKNLPRKEAVEILRKQCHEAIIALTGVENNPWPAQGD
jgi:1-acyl-sn-glycerol-3-phosphate acyltransferase